MHPTCPNLSRMLPSIGLCFRREGDQSLTDLRFIEREDVFAIDMQVNCLFPSSGGSLPATASPHSGQRTYFMLRRAARLSLQMDSRSHRYDLYFLPFCHASPPEDASPTRHRFLRRCPIFTSVNRRAWRNAVLALYLHGPTHFCIFGSRNTFGISMS